jgi:hypothetical protein
MSSTRFARSSGLPEISGAAPTELIIYSDFV